MFQARSRDALNVLFSEPDVFPRGNFDVFAIYSPQTKALYGHFTVPSNSSRIDQLERDQGHATFKSAVPQSGQNVQINSVVPDSRPCLVDWDTQPIPTPGRNFARTDDPGTSPGARSVIGTTPGAGVYYFRIE
jgi:hypothetical protein